ncbi:MAG TPA: response regulator transcription factor [Patescibacteria group bacterium]|nr:response regulator transcription factor [Patescibacteria group bacterium]
MAAARPPRLRVLVAAPLPADVGGVAAVLGAAGHEVLTAYRLDIVLARLVDDRPDVLIVDPAIADGAPAEVVGRIGGYSDAPLLVLADVVDEAVVVEALDAGAVDVVGRPLRPLELLGRIAAAARRSGTGAAEAADLADGLRVDAAQRTAAVAGRDLGLTPIELDLLAAMAARRGGVVDHRLLLRAAWPNPAVVDLETLRTHLARLNAKLVGAGHPGLRNVRSRGYAIRVQGAAPEG